MVDKNIIEKSKLQEIVRDSYLQNPLNNLNFEDLNKATTSTDLDGFIKSFDGKASIEFLQDLYGILGILHDESLIPQTYFNSLEFQHWFSFTLIPTFFDNNKFTNYNYDIKKEFWKKLFTINCSKNNEKGEIKEKKHLYRILKEILNTSLYAIYFFNATILPFILKDKKHKIEKKFDPEEIKELGRFVEKKFRKSEKLVFQLAMPDYRMKRVLFELIKRLFSLIHEEISKFEFEDLMDLLCGISNENPLKLTDLNESGSDDNQYDKVNQSQDDLSISYSDEDKFEFKSFQDLNTDKLIDKFCDIRLFDEVFKVVFSFSDKKILNDDSSSGYCSSDSKESN